ncbi:MAG: hypothetical protein IJT27_10070 [Clostridia bacterium]|nr:hypothetical protein [Clostridia bacterium]
MNYLLYPYSDDLADVVRYIPDYHADMQVSKLASPYAWKYNIKNNENVSFDFPLDDVEGVIFAEVSKKYQKNTLLYKDIVAKIQYTLNSKKDVICVKQLQEQDAADLKKLAQENGCAFDYYESKRNNYDMESMFQTQECIMIGVGGTLEEVTTLPVIVNLAARLKEAGYRVTTVADDMNVSLLGFERFPSYFFDETQDYMQIVHKFNKFYKNLQLLHQPEIILTQIPNGFMKYSNSCLENFGVKAFMLSQAVNLDYFVLCASLEPTSIEEFEQLSEMFKYRFGFEINAIGFSDQRIDDTASKERDMVIYNQVSCDTVAKYINALNTCKKRIFCFNMFDLSSFGPLAENVLGELSGG